MVTERTYIYRTAMKRAGRGEIEKDVGSGGGREGTEGGVVNGAIEKRIAVRRNLSS
jgi:hypothetical protein